MCGIAGFKTSHFPSLSHQDLINMGNAIAHRGPDAHGEYLDDHVGLSHRRLSILDLSEAGNQPMYSDDKQLVIVFNGEIYNFLDIKNDLKQRGIAFKTGTDTEVILHLYAIYGVDCVDKLNGMFAFAIWDCQQEELFIARDRAGKKPLYYLQHEGRFAFASEIKALLTLPDVPKDIRLDAVYDFFTYQYVPDPKSIFTHIHKLPAGYYMKVRGDEIEIHQYWDLTFSETPAKDEEKAKHELQELLQQCTKRRMISDVPLGAFLSGGVDSSGVVAMMTAQTEKPVKTCTVAFDDEQYNEAEFARIVAEQYQTEHHEFTVNQNVADRLEEIVEYFDEPFADPSLVPTFFVSELARSAVTVAVAGDGGDEVFAGYEKYSTDHLENKLRNKFPAWIRNTIFKHLATLLKDAKHPILRKAKSLFTSLSVSPAYGFFITNSQMSDAEWNKLASIDLQKALGDYHPSNVTTDVYAKATGSDHLSKILYTDIKTYMCGGILVKVDRMSMANSLEVRAPILDKEIMEFSANLDSALKFKCGEKKYLLKEAFKEKLPDEILYRKKMGFSVPLDTWLRHDIKAIAENYLITNATGLKEIFKPSVIHQYWKEHQNAQANHGAILWSMLMYEMWYQKYIGQQ